MLARNGKTYKRKLYLKNICNKKNAGILGKKQLFDICLFLFILIYIY